MDKGRPKMAPGSWGEITRTKLAPGVWSARCRYVPADSPAGQWKRTSAKSPSGERDQHGSKAEAALLVRLAELVKPGRERPGGESTLSVLVSAAVQEVRDSPKQYARRTMDSYALAASVLCSESKVCKANGHNHLGVATGKPAHSITAADLKAAVRDVERGHDRVMARHCRTLLRKVGGHLVDERVWSHDYSLSITFARERHGAAAAAARVEAQALTAAEARKLLVDLRSSEAALPPASGAKRSRSGRTVAEFCGSVDLADPVELLLWTGMRRSELLAVTWSDFDAAAKSLSVRHHVVRVTLPDGGSELVHERDTKSSSAVRVIPLTDQAAAMLERRRREVMSGARLRSRSGVPDVIFPSPRGLGLRDPDSFAGDWRRVRGALGVPWLGLHGFRRSAARLLHEQGVSLRTIASLLGHADTQMTQTYIVADSDGVPASAVALLGAALAE